METKHLKPTLPALAKLGGANIGIASAEGRITISTLCGTLAVSAPSPASASSPWRSVDTRRFRRVLDSAPAILLTDTGDRLVWQAGRATVALPTDAAEPPTVPPPDGPGVSVNAGEHVRALEYLLTAVSSDDTRPNLHHIAAYRTGAWEATDGHRLHRVHTRCNLHGQAPSGSGEDPLLLPAEQLAACLSMLRRAEGKVTYHVKPLDPAKPGWTLPKNTLRWTLPGDVRVTLTWEDPRVAFPHTAPLWSGVQALPVRETEADPLIDALRQGAKLVGTKKPLATLSVESSRLRLRVDESTVIWDSSERRRKHVIPSGGLEYETALDITGERGEAPLADRYAFNANYMVEALTLAKGDERGSDYARIALPKEKTAPIHVSRGAYEALVMPIATA